MALKGMPQNLTSVRFKVIRHQAITWTNIEQVLWHHMVSLDNNELREKFPLSMI